MAYQDPAAIIAGYQNLAITSKWSQYVDANNNDKVHQLITNSAIFSDFIIDCVKYYNESDNKQIFQIFSAIFSHNIFTANNFMSEIQKNPILLAEMLKRMEYNFLSSNKEFFKKLILYSLSSKYQIVDVSTEEKIEALIKIKNKLHGINSKELNFKNIINRIIYDDYCCGLDLDMVTAERNKFCNKVYIDQADIDKDQNNEDEEDNEIENTENDFSKIQNIILSKQCLVDKSKNKIRIRNNNVLALFQNPNSNKLYFSANRKTGQEHNGKTCAQLIVDNFLDYLTPASLERILSTFGLYKQPHANNINTNNLTTYNKYVKETYEIGNVDIGNDQRKKNQDNFIKNIKNNKVPGTNTINNIIDNNEARLQITNNISQQSDIKDERYNNDNNKMIETIIRSNEFKKIKIDNYVPYCEKLKTNFSQIREQDIEKKHFLDVFFDNFKIKHIDILSSILNMNYFESFKEEYITKIVDSLIKIKEIKKDQPYSIESDDNSKNMSTIIECAKKLYFHKNANKDIKESIIKYIKNIITKINYKTDKNMYLIGNSLIHDEEQTRYDNKIMIKDYEFLEKIVDEVNNSIRDDNNLQEQFANIFSSAMNNVESTRVFLLLAKNKLFTKRKIITESLDMFYKQQYRLINFWSTSKEDFIENVLRYAEIKCPSDNYEQQLDLLSVIAQKQYKFSRAVGKGASKKIIDATILMKGLADGLRYIDFNNSYKDIESTIKTANMIYTKINKSNEISVDEENTLFTIIAELKKNVEKQFICAEKIVNKKILDSNNDHALITMSKEIKQCINFINKQIKNPAYDDIDSNGHIKQEIFELERHFKKLRAAYNRLMYYNNRNISKNTYNKQQKENILNAKNTLINSLKSMMIKKQKEWNEIFILNKDKQNSKLKDFFNKTYSDIDDYAVQILNQISKYKGTDIESMQNQAKKDIEKLEIKISNFDTDIKLAVQTTNNYNKDLSKNSKQNSNISNSIIRNNDKDKNKIQEYETQILDICSEKNKQALKNFNIKDNNNKIYDGKQLAILYAMACNFIGTLLAVIVFTNPIIVATGTVTQIGLQATMKYRANKKKRQNDINNVKNSVEEYEETFEKKEKEDIENDGQNTDDEEKEILKKVDVNLDDNKKQPVLA